MNILCICPSIYPKKLEKMTDSFLTTRSKYTHLYVDNRQDVTVTQIFNEAFMDNPNFDFYFMANDDIIFETPLWDLALANKCKISYGDDGFQGINLPTFPMIDGDIVRALGWLQMPQLNRYSGDMIWKFIGQECGILNYVPEVKITHQWEGCSHSDINDHDMKEFGKWLPWSFKDLTKVRSILNGISCNKLGR